MNKYLDTIYRKREGTQKKTFDIDIDFYEKIVELSQYYYANIGDIINACIAHLLETQNIHLYEKEDELFEKHTLSVWESNIAGLEKINSRRGISIHKLVNVALRNVLEDES